MLFFFVTGKSLSEAFILTSTNPHYDKRLFIDLPVQYIKTTGSEHVVCINCSECQNKKQFMCTRCPELVVFMYWTGKSMNNLLSYCGLVDVRINASDKDLPLQSLELEEELQKSSKVDFEKQVNQRKLFWNVSRSIVLTENLSHLL